MRRKQQKKWNIKKLTKTILGTIKLIRTTSSVIKMPSVKKIWEATTTQTRTKMEYMTLSSTTRSTTTTKKQSEKQG